MIKMYGIPNCDIIKKAGAWLKKNDIAFELHDYKKQGIDASKLKEWIGLKGWETIFNKRSTTWKEIMKEVVINNQHDAIQIMQQHTSIIKRPVIEINDDIIVGYDEKAYIEKLLGKKSSK
ncbi:MAG: Spx/MgsR family RNA polymerase-binding regulatory protein [Sphingobacteriales bacterium]|nr:MAG: Spx/MgsR family RNA polymerase-binding regulatory protein [Sphingobacteriales bacterium]